MKKLIVSLFVMGASYLSVQGQVFSTTIGSNPTTLTNVLANTIPTNGSFVISQLIYTAGVSNSAVTLIDSPNGTLTNLTAAYTNYISYATNWNTTWTNIYGVIQTNPVPIIALIDATNAVSAVTNTRPQILTISALAGTSTIINNANYSFSQGIFATNTSTAGSGNGSLTIVYRPR